MFTTTIVLGFLTHHYIAPSLSYCNKVGGVGTIVNPYMIGLVGKSNSKFKVGGILGIDSVCGVIGGMVFTYKLSPQWEFVMGGYNTNYKKFINRNMEPVHVGKIITPVLGVNYKYQIDKNISLNTTISLGIVTQGIRFDF